MSPTVTRSGDSGADGGTSRPLTVSSGGGDGLVEDLLVEARRIGHQDGAAGITPARNRSWTPDERTAYAQGHIAGTLSRLRAAKTTPAPPTPIRVEPWEISA